jgi:hypothetical protein
MAKSASQLAFVLLSVFTGTTLAMQYDPDYPADNGPGCTPPSSTYKPAYEPTGVNGSIGTSFAVLDLIVKKDGSSADIHVRRGSCSEAQAIYAIEHLQQWKFNPAVCNGKAVAMRFSFTENFILKPPHCPTSGCMLPIVPENPAIAGFRLPKLKIDVDELIYERDHYIRLLKSVDVMLAAKSFAERARIYCRSQNSAFPLIPDLGNVDDLEASYAELSANEPPTREQEVKRQYKLRMWRDRLTAAYDNAASCEGAATLGLQPLPTVEQEYKIVTISKERLAKIDALLNK